MKRKKYTVLLIPDDERNPRSFQINIRFLKLFLIFSLVLLAAIAIFSVIFIPRALHYSSLEKENIKLLQERFKFLRIMEDYARIRNMDRYIRRSLGIPLSLQSSFGYAFTDTAIVSDTTDTLTGFELPAAVSEEFFTPLVQRGKLDFISYLDNIPTFPPLEGFVTRGFVENLDFPDEGHFGLDIVARKGDVVRAAAGGLIVFSNWTYHSGYMIVVYHGDGYFSIYSHNQRNLVNERDYVERGEPIAFMGDTGISRGPHLHFEIWKDGVPVNPIDYIFVYRENDISIH